MTNNQRRELTTAQKQRRDIFLKNLKTSLQGEQRDARSTCQIQSMQDASKDYINFNYQPTKLSEEDCLISLKEFLSSQSAEIHEVANPAEIQETVASILKNKPYGNDILIGENPFIQNRVKPIGTALNFIESKAHEREREKGELPLAMTLAMTTAFAAAAETGTLFFASDKQNPTWLNYLPTCHIALLNKKTICQTYEQAFALGKKHSEEEGQSFPPRSINMISGPSRTADIEQTLTLGAHGPIELIIIIYSDDVSTI